jgi:hypothetical protein
MSFLQNREYACSRDFATSAIAYGALRLCYKSHIKPLAIAAFLMRIDNDLHIGYQKHKIYCVELKNKAIANPKMRPAELLIKDLFPEQLINPNFQHST